MLAIPLMIVGDIASLGEYCDRPPQFAAKFSLVYALRFPCFCKDIKHPETEDVEINGTKYALTSVAITRSTHIPSIQEVNI